MKMITALRTVLALLLVRYHNRLDFRAVIMIVEHSSRAANPRLFSAFPPRFCKAGMRT
jgi:hypothetical protein